MPNEQHLKPPLAGVEGCEDRLTAFERFHG
jgi:hypothetical protein